MSNPKRRRSGPPTVETRDPNDRRWQLPPATVARLEKSTRGPILLDAAAHHADILARLAMLDDDAPDLDDLDDDPPPF